MTTVQPAADDQAINLRVSRGQRDLIERASRVLGKSAIDFKLDAACRRAEDVLLDQTLFRLDPAAHEQFNALLDSPPEPSEALRGLLHRRAPWE